jgi:hypothetical protein
MILIFGILQHHHKSTSNLREISLLEIRVLLVRGVRKNLLSKGNHLQDKLLAKELLLE